MILVTGATGTIGTSVVELLAAQGVPVRAMTRSPARVTADVEVVSGDFDDRDSLRAAVAGVDAVFMLSAPGESIATHDLALLDAATDVPRVVKISAIHTGTPGFELTSGWHLPGEQAIAASDKTWTILRPTSFASNSLGWLPQIKAGQPIPNLFGAGTNGVVDPRDVAAVAVQALLADGHDKQTYTLTGPELLTLPAQVAQLGEVLGRALATVDVAPEEARAGMIARGVAPESADLMVASFELVARGANAVVTSDVEKVLGRAPRTFREWARDHAAAFV